MTRLPEHLRAQFSRLLADLLIADYRAHPPEARMTVTILRVNGTVETHDIPQAEVFNRLRDLIQASGFDTVNLRDGRVMIVDDNGYETELVDHGLQPGPPDGKMMQTWERRCISANKPVNPEATKLYHGICKPGVTHEIVGDVAIVRDADFT